MTTTDENDCNYCGRLSINANPVAALMGPHVCIECLTRLNEIMKGGWNENSSELQLVVLQVLYFVRLRKRAEGATESMIRDVLGLDQLFNIRKAVTILQENGYIQQKEAGFVITDRGAEFVIDQVPELDRLE